MQSLDLGIIRYSNLGIGKGSQTFDSLGICNSTIRRGDDPKLVVVLFAEPFQTIVNQIDARKLEERNDKICTFYVSFYLGI